MNTETEVVKIQEELAKLRPVKLQQEKQLGIINEVYSSMTTFLRALNDAHLSLNKRKQELVEVLEKNKDALKAMIDSTPALKGVNQEYMHRL